MQAAARRERPHELVLREVEGVVRLVEEDAATLGHDGEVPHPAHEVGDVGGRDLDALGAARRARGEDDVVGLLALDPALARGHGELALPARHGLVGGKLAHVDDAVGGQHAREGRRHVLAAREGGILYLAHDVTHAR